MPSVVRLNRNQLIEWIESTEAGGGDVTELRSALEASGPDQDSRTRRHGVRVNSAEELTMAERLNNRVGDLFAGGLSDDLLAHWGLSIQLPSPSCTKGDSVPALLSSAIFFNSFAWDRVPPLSPSFAILTCFTSVS
jgi:hypothetical protein